MTMHTNEIITNRIIEKLQEGIIPWERPWIGGEAPSNYISKKPYSFINSMLLCHSGYHMSYKQLQEKKGKMVKPEGLELKKRDGTPIDWDSLSEAAKFNTLSDIVCFYKEDKKEKGLDPETGEMTYEKRYILRYYRVVWEGYTTLNTKPTTTENKPRIKACEQLKDFYSKRENISIIEDGDKAYYAPSEDYINVPPLAYFKNTESFYATTFHEMTHSTGAKKRLNREIENKFGSKAYAREELVAEMGSAFLTNHFGIRTEAIERNNTAYIQSWIKALQNDADLIIKASAKAQKALDFILDGFEETEEAPETPKGPEAKTPKALLSAAKKIAKDGIVTRNDDGTATYINKKHTLAMVCKDVGIPATQRSVSPETIKRLTPITNAATDAPTDIKQAKERLKGTRQMTGSRVKGVYVLPSGTVLDINLLEMALKGVGNNARILYNENSKDKTVIITGENGTALLCPIRSISLCQYPNTNYGYIA